MHVTTYNVCYALIDWCLYALFHKGDCRQVDASSTATCFTVLVSGANAMSLLRNEQSRLRQKLSPCSIQNLLQDSQGSFDRECNFRGQLVGDCHWESGTVQTWQERGSPSSLSASCWSVMDKAATTWVNLVLPSANSIGNVSASQRLTNSRRKPETQV